MRGSGRRCRMSEAWAALAAVVLVATALGARAGDDSAREELDRCVSEYRNETAHRRESARKTLEASLSSARKKKDAKAVEKIEGQLRALADKGEIPNEAGTAALLKATMKEEDHLLSVYDRVERHYAGLGEEEKAERVRRECAEFVASLRTSEDDRTLRANKLTRRGRYYVILPVERSAFQKYDEADRLCRLFQDARAVAQAILTFDEEYATAYRNLIDARARVQHYDNRINNAKGPARQQLVAERADADAVRIECRRRYDQAWLSLATLKQRHEAEEQFKRTLEDHRQGLVALRPILKAVSSEYRAARTPEVDRALGRLGKSLGPSVEYRKMVAKVGKAERELKGMKVDLKPNEYVTRPKL